MGIFNKAVVTAKGQALLTKSVAGLCEIQFTRLALSEERLGDDLISVTDIGEIKQSSPISAVEIRDDVSVSMEAVFANTDLTVGYYIRNIGLYAKDPDEGEILYSVSVADESEVSAGYMPPFDGIFGKSLLIELVTAVSSADKVTVAVDPTVYATVTQLNDLKKATDKQIATQAEELYRESEDRKSHDKMLSARMDAFTSLPEGSTTGDAELIDGRVSRNGEVYANIGDHIRGETGKLSEDIADETKNRQNAVAQERNRAVARENEIEGLFTMPTQEAVSKWLDEHPEATTTVQDRSLTIDKMVVGTLGYVTPHMFGAKGDGVTDDTKAFFDALNYCNSNNISDMFVPNGTYVIDSVGDISNDANVRYGKLFLPSNFQFRMAENCYLKVKPNNSPSYSCLSVKDAENVLITGGHIIGDADEHNGTNGEWGFGIMVDASKHITIDNVNISKCWGDCIDLRSASKWVEPEKPENQNIKILNCVLSDSRRQGISVESGIGVVIENCNISGIRGTAPQSGIDIEGNGKEITENIVISNCTITDCFRGIALWTAKGCVIENCYIEAESYQIGTSNGIDKCVVRNCILNGYVEIKCDIAFYGNTFKNSQVNITRVGDGCDYENVVIDGNIFDNSRIISYKEAEAEITGITISNNTFMNLAENNPIDIWYVDGTYIVNNIFKDLACGLQLLYCNKSNVARNTFEKIKQTPIYIGGCKYTGVTNNRLFNCVNEKDAHESTSNINDAYGSYNDISYNFICGGYGDISVGGISIKSDNSKCTLNSIIADNGKLTIGITVNANNGRYAYNDVSTIATPFYVEDGKTGNKIEEQFYP